MMPPPNPPVKTSSSVLVQRPQEEPRHVFHRQCRRGRGAEVSSATDFDLAVLAFGRCRVSLDWCSYFARFVGADPSGEKCKRVHVQHVEELELLVRESRWAELATLEEAFFHSAVQLVILGPDLLNWIARLPAIPIGKGQKPYYGLN